MNIKAFTDVRLPRVLLSIALTIFVPISSATQGSTQDKQNIPHSRQKRTLWITNDGRLALPPGTTMVISPSLSMPFVRHPPDGFFSNITVSLPFTIDFDKLGLTDNENPYGTLPPLFARSLGRAAGTMMGDYVGQYLDNRRGKRNVLDEQKKLPREVEKNILQNFHGGERALLYGAAEDMISNFGFAGKPCLLRAICEIHAHPLTNYGFLGEVLKLFFTASKSPYSKLLEEYVEAERCGTDKGECWPYFKECPKSLFLPVTNKYSKPAQHQSEYDTKDEVDQNVLQFTQAM